MAENENIPHSKVKGKALIRVSGLTIYGKVTMPKRRGKARVLIQIRQDKTHDWHVSECLSYTRSVDIIFATDTDRDSKGRIV
jgi:hypothetical protein